MYEYRAKLKRVVDGDTVDFVWILVLMCIRPYEPDCWELTRQNEDIQTGRKQPPNVLD